MAPRTPTVRPANGVEGCLCVTLDQGYFLRVKDDRAPEGFVDYQLRHSDLQVRIIDEDAAFYDFGPNLGPLARSCPGHARPDEQLAFTRPWSSAATATGWKAAPVATLRNI